MSEVKDYRIRTVNPYATYGPGDGRSWREYFDTIRNDDKEEAEVVARNEVTIQGHSIAVTELPKNIRAVADLIPDVKARHSQTWHEGEVFKSGPRQGEKRPDKLVDHFAIAWAGNGGVIVASWSDGKMNYGLIQFLNEGDEIYTELVTEFKKTVKGVFDE